MVVSQNGYPAGDRSVLYNPSVPGTSILFPGGLRKGPAGELLLYVAAQLHARVENGGTGYGMWGYNYRDIRGFRMPAGARVEGLDALIELHPANRPCCVDNEDTLFAASSLSNHSSGTAFDWHAPRHPLGKRGTYSAAQVAKIHAIVNVECEGAVRWGGDYSGRVDEMHYEIVKNESECARVLKKLRGSSPAPTPMVPVTRTLQYSSVSPMIGEDVKSLQRVLNAWYKVVRPVWWPLVVDGVFSVTTDAAVRFMQEKAGLVVDGVVGPATRKALGL